MFLIVHLASQEMKVMQIVNLDLHPIEVVLKTMKEVEKEEREEADVVVVEDVVEADVVEVMVVEVKEVEMEVEVKAEVKVEVKEEVKVVEVKVAAVVVAVVEDLAILKNMNMKRKRQNLVFLQQPPSLSLIYLSHSEMKT